MHVCHSESCTDVKIIMHIFVTANLVLPFGFSCIQTNQQKIEKQLKDSERCINRLLKMGVPVPSLTPKPVTCASPSVTLTSAVPVSPLTIAKSEPQDQVSTIIYMLVAVPTIQWYDFHFVTIIL